MSLPLLFALTLHTLSGTVYDASGDVMSNVRVQATGPDGTRREVVAKDGRYVFSDLGDGDYVVRVVSVAGYAPETVHLADDATLDLRLTGRMACPASGSSGAARRRARRRPAGWTPVRRSNVRSRSDSV